MNFLSERFVGPFYLEGLFGLNVHKLFYVLEFSKWSNQPKFIQLFGRIPQPALESIIYLYHSYTINSSTILAEYFEHWTHIWNVNVSVGIFQRNRFHSNDENHKEFVRRYFNYGKFETVYRRAGYTNQSRKLHFSKVFYKLKSVITFSILFFPQFQQCWQWKFDEQSVSDNLLYSQELDFCFSGDTAGRNQMLVILRG